MNTRHREGGQVLVLIILAIVGLFGFAALAVDGGRFFAERRRAQTAADAAVMASAFAGATGHDWSNAGIVSTQRNGFDDLDPNENAGADVDVRVYHSPVRGRYSVASETVNPNEYYQVIIRTRVDQVFSQIVFSGDLWVEVEAVARGIPQTGFPSGAAMVATCRDCCDAILFRGTGDIVIDGGSVISHSTQTGSSSDEAACHSAARRGEAVVDILDGDLIAGGTLYNNTKKACKHADGTVASPCIDADSILTNTPDPQSYLYPHVPSCAGLPTVTSATYNKTRTISSGIYSNGITATGNNTVLTLNPGLYCLDGDLTIDSASIVGNNVMFYMRNGSVKILTNNPVTLSAPVGTANCIADPTIAPDCWSGFLIYMRYENPGIVYMAGGGSTSYTGTIYAPGPLSPNPFTLTGHGSFTHKCTIQGSQVETVMNASIICHTISVAGGNGFNITYNDDLNAQSPGAIELTE